jgi:hypothetical protein
VLTPPGLINLLMSRIVHSGGIDRENDAKMAFDTNEKVQVMSSFDSLNLKEDLLRGIYAYSNISWI